ncbi:MAG: hypothetical protein EKK41_02145 [Hyphomicrobiales bacterium]|nr:MAG: hypothetical protein EKK41_02145 [Hyphomicrobiales bacterium]
MDLRRAGRFNLDIDAGADGELIARSWESLEGWEDAVSRRERVEAEHQVQGEKILSTNRFEPNDVWVAAFWSKVADGVAPSAVVNRDDWHGWIYEVIPAELHVFGLPDGTRSVCVWTTKDESIVRGTLRCRAGLL